MGITVAHLPSGPSPLVRIYTSLAEGERSLRLVVVNRSPTQSMRVTYDLRGFSPAACGRAWQIAGDSITATDENVGGPPDAVRIETLDLEGVRQQFLFVAPAHSVTAIALDRGL